MNEPNITRQAGKTNAEGTEIVSDIVTRMLAAGELPALQEALRLKELDLGRRATSEPARTPTQPPRRQQPRVRKKQLVLVGLGNG
jgi:hypothetical protein